MEQFNLLLYIKQYTHLSPLLLFKTHIKQDDIKSQSVSLTEWYVWKGQILYLLKSSKNKEMGDHCVFSEKTQELLNHLWITFQWSIVPMWVFLW
jgi:hypothetical protein